MSRCLLLTVQTDLYAQVRPPLLRCGLHLEARPDLSEPDTGHRYEVVMVDLRGPAGLCDTVCQQAKQRWSAHTLAVVDPHEAMAAALALELGADAVLSVPWSAFELEARVQSLRRRAAAAHRTPHRDIVAAATTVPRVDTDARRLRLPSARWLELSSSECAVLNALIAEPGRAMSRGELIARTGLALGSRNPNVVDLAVSRLRRKLATAGMDASLIQTVRGQGYAWTACPAWDATYHSLVAQSIDGIEVGRPACRDVAKHHAHQE